MRKEWGVVWNGQITSETLLLAFLCNTYATGAGSVWNPHVLQDSFHCALNWAWRETHPNSPIFLNPDRSSHDISYPQRWTFRVIRD